jgi:hypothetical protein
MKLEIPEGFNEIQITEKFVNGWLEKARNSNHDKDYYGFLTVGHFLMKVKIHFNKKLDEEYLKKVIRFFYFWLNSYVLTLNEKELLCGYILSFVVEKKKIDYKLIKKMKGLI